ncbi:60S acidic ribosomal protein P3-like isoform X1 [Vitis riparia]|uniref:60S acidic ribosomal protein P3-like isoform X1 n=1 Tax=Vitis riparia TaxID=96939 RepID=UPI00155A7797|nr:60S acidic ribosomal protein P3-like isoform X1 [Vitis riparia]
MGVFTFVCRSSGKEWTAKQMNGDLEESAASTYDLQRKCVQSALSADSSGGVQSSFSYVTPSSGVFQVIVGAVEAAASLVVVELLQQHLLGEGHRQLMHLQLRRKRKRRKRVMTIWDSHSLISATLYTQVFILWPNISRTFCIWVFQVG